MNIQSTNAASGTSAGGAGASKATAAGGIFQGVLVQKIDAAGPAEGKNAAMANPMPGLLGMLSAALAIAPNDSQPAEPSQAADELSQLLDGLEEQLAQLQQGNELPDSQMDQLAELLASLQTLLQPKMLQIPSVTESTTATDAQGQLQPDAASAIQSQPAFSLTALQDAVQALRTLLQAGKLTSGEIAETGASIKNVLLAGQDIPAANTGNRSKTAQHVSFTDRIAKARSDDGDVAVNVEVKKTYAVFKEPVVYWNLNANAATEDSAPSAASVPADSLPGVEEQPANLNWQSLIGDPASKPDLSASVKQQIPVTVPGQQFAEQMDKFLVKQFTLSGGNGISEANINLHPEHLGEVQIRLTIQHGVLNAQFVAHNEAARELLDNQMAQLRGTLQSQGIQVDRVEVVQHQPQASESSAFLFQEQRRQQSGNGESKRSNGAGVETLEEFEEELERSASLRDAGYGSALNVIA
ncbi:flagellar hook-length control protein FliK [Cohnella hashimotonis]|uniref:Flagellar hook-length control protein FliK n=1 Tax=Cohnella hashimotonis TaxID=2826895 RepID=A0ABT6THA1_9BACL|nr:flagellar hook-length control protein FliK [Cohnella hashimotonis]MDI4646218.1 flagellar hook-length control protein FliK [Cohnella hashimotonis]